jgi:subtilase family serine protease
MRYYLSTDDSLDAGDVLLGSRAIGGLAASWVLTTTTVVTIPANTSVPNSYRIIAFVDALDQQAEVHEDNNLAVSAPIPVTAYQPDLTITIPTVPAAGAAGRPLAVTDSVRNAGPAPAGAFVVQFFLATGPTHGDADVLVGSRTIAGLAAGGVSTATTMLTIPAATPVPAPYWIIAVADALNQQAELSKDNNIAVSPSAVNITAYQPDLAMTIDSLSATAVTGHAVVVRNTVRNAGPAPAGPFVVRFYLAAGQTPSATDVLLGSRALAGLAAGVASPAVTSLTIPAATAAPAQYWIIAVADALNQQAELHEDNNTAVSSSTVAVAAF